MKKALLLALLFIVSCDKDRLSPAKGRAVFSMSSVNRSLVAGRIEQDVIPACVLLSVEDSNGKTVLLNKKLPLFSFGQNYSSESLELNVGDYSLIQFQVLDANNSIIYATPLEGTALAQYVADPLPIHFSIGKDVNTQVVPQVLLVSSDDTPENFGYASFGFEVVKPDSSIDVNFKFKSGIVYDSVNVKFTNGTKIIKSKMLLTSGMATTQIAAFEFSGNGVCANCWDMELSAYYDGKLYQDSDTYLYETRVTAGFQLTSIVNEIEIDPNLSEVSLKSSGLISSKFATYAHGYIRNNFHIEVNADTPCDSHIQFSVRSGTTYVYTDRTLYYKTASDMHAIYYNYFESTDSFNGEVIDLTTKFADLDAACSQANWNGNKWNYADQIFYAESNGEVFSWFYMWSKDLKNGRLAFKPTVSLLVNRAEIKRRKSR